MINQQIVLLALMAFGAANCAAVPTGQQLEQQLAIARDYSQGADFANQHIDKRLIGLLDIGGTHSALARNSDPPTRAEAGMQAAGVYNPPNDDQQRQHKALHGHDEHQHKASSDKKGGNGDRKGNSGPAAVSSAVAAAGTASPTVSNDEGVEPAKTDASSTSDAKATSSASSGKDTDAKPTKAAAAAASSIPSTTGTWSWQAGAFGCPDGANPKGTKHLCSATAVTSFTETDGSKGVATDANVASSSASSASPTGTTSSKAATKHSHKEESSGGCDDEEEDDGDDDVSAATALGDKDGPKTKHNHDQPAPALANSTTSAVPSSAPSLRINIPSANTSNAGRVMIPLNRKRSFEGTFEEKKQRYQMLKSMNNEINKLKKVLKAEVKTQQEHKLKSSKSVGGASAKTVVYNDLKAVDKQINQLKETLTKEIDRPGVELIGGHVNGAVTDDLKAVNDQIDAIRKVLNKGATQKSTAAVTGDIKAVNAQIKDIKKVLAQQAQSAVTDDIKAVNAQISDIKKVLASKPVQPAVVSADHAHFKQLPAATHNSVAAEHAAQEEAHKLDEATQPRFTVEKKNLCALASIIFGVVGLLPLAVLALVRHKSRAVFYGAFVSLVAGSLYVLYILENTLLFHGVLPSTFTLAYLSLLCLQSIFALLVRTPSLTRGNGYVVLQGDEEDKERV